MKKKKKSRRDSVNNPNLDPKYNTKLRRDYMDNRHYVKGVKDASGKLVMKPLPEDAKNFLDKFNKEYYSASFDDPFEYDGLHKSKVDKQTVDSIKSQIKTLKKHRKRIFDKSPNTTTEEDRNLALFYTEQIEDLEEFLNEIHPRRECEHRNNQRNADFLNYSKASNKYDLVSWETLGENDLYEVDPEFCPEYFNVKLEDED